MHLLREQYNLPYKIRVLNVLQHNYPSQQSPRAANKRLQALKGHGLYWSKNYRQLTDPEPVGPVHFFCILLLQTI
ncbi:hypothetical protein D3C87_1772780 [compost metagenome]